MTSAAQLAKQLGFVAGDLDRRGYAMAGVVRQAARHLLDVPEPNTGGCRGCGAELPTASTGPPRVWCSEMCRRRYRP